LGGAPGPLGAPPTAGHGQLTTSIVPALQAGGMV
jgi:hypothetical protein